MVHFGGNEPPKLDNKTFLYSLSMTFPVVRMCLRNIYKPSTGSAVVKKIGKTVLTTTDLVEDQ